MAVAVTAQLQGTIVGLLVDAGASVRAGQVVALVESMKMHHEVIAPVGGVVESVAVADGDTVAVGQPLLHVDERAGAADQGLASAGPATGPLGLERDDLREVIERHERGLDDHRPDAVARRRARGRRTARENVADLVDAGTFVEYGPLVIAAQRRRRPVEELIAATPADGLVGGIAEVNGELFADGPRAAKCVVVSYDYTVLAGTQGTQNHRKKDRLFEVAEQLRIPIVFFTEGGGGRPGDTDGLGVSGLDCLAFRWFAELSGTVPLVGVASGYCFAGNAAILGCCDVVIATEDSNIGMGGPAMIEGGGLGVFEPTEIGPIEVQRANGVVDVVVADEAEAVAVARRYLSYFQGRTADWVEPDQTLLRDVVPVDRLRAYDIRAAIDGLFDEGSVLELRRDFGVGMVTALARIEGRPVGVVANDPGHLAGAIDSDGADKAARFMQLCDAFGLPIVTLVDTPGMMVGPDVEATALVRHCSRLFVVGANLSVPMVSIVTRKSYGLGAQAMMGGTTKAPLACLAWPTGEFGGMGLEGAVRLGYRKELEAVADDAERDVLFREMVDRMYEHGKAVSVATHFEIDDVIDPADSRRWITTLFDSAPETHRSSVDPGRAPRRPNVDTW
ncbi:MAG TPA: carboxyl transferase domain-containing protein [Ilumatobacteraceae bacterium]|nr:carboxyl transferase domain-containing protein [Ilumatobacteraceae bacterium]